MIETSPTTAKLDAALAKAQGEISAAIKDSPNPAFKTKYADLSAVMEAIRPALARNAISVTQWPVHSTDDRVHMVTRIAHDGEWMRATFSMPVQKKDAHGYGSIVTYLRRYCIASCFGVISDVDDDGNAASGKASAEPPAPITAEQFRTLKDLIEKTGTDESKLLAFIKGESLETLTVVQFQAAEAALRKKLNTPKAEAA
jgi:hypothetical protein